MAQNTLNLTAIIDTINSELEKLDAHLASRADQGSLDARALDLLHVKFQLRNTVSALRDICPRLGENGGEGFIPGLSDGS